MLRLWTKLADLSNTIDGAGIYGHILHYALVIAFVGSALLIFFYLWSKGKLDMDEEPKMRMMDDEDKGEKNDRT